MSLGEQIKQLRVERGLNQPDLAEMAGIEQSYLSKLENGKSVPSNEIFRKLLQALETNLDQFLTRFDLVADKPHLAQVPDIEHWYKQREKNKLVSQRNFLYICSALVVLSVTLFYAGYSKQLFSETHYVYYSKGILKDDEPNGYFDIWVKVLNTKLQGIPIESEEAQKLRKSIQVEMLKRETEHHLMTQENLGGSFEKRVDGGRRFYTRYKQTDVPKAINGWLQVLGVMLFSMGVMGFFMERRLYKL